MRKLVNDNVLTIERLIHNIIGGNVDVIVFLQV
jgi:hypothetical protein